MSSLPAGDKQSTLMSMWVFSMQHGMLWVGNPILPEQHAGVPYDEAHTRLLIADACEALGDVDGAQMERRAAGSTLNALGGKVTQSPDDGLTARETEVLTLVAQGKTNRAIAVELCISEKTVASHLNHIFTKLGLQSRSAATAYAYQHDLMA